MNASARVYEPRSGRRIFTFDSDFMPIGWLVEVDRPCVEGRQLTVWLVGDSSWCAGPSDEASLQFAASEGLPPDPRETAAKAWSHEAGVILTRRVEIATDLDRVASKRAIRELTAHCFSTPPRCLSDGAAKR